MSELKGCESRTGSRDMRLLLNLEADNWGYVV